MNPSDKEQPMSERDKYAKLIMNADILHDAKLFLDEYTAKQVAKSEREARIDEWKLVGETLNSSLIAAELHAHKIQQERIAELKAQQEQS